MKKLFLVACLLGVSCNGSPSLPSVADLENDGRPPLVFIHMSKSANPKVSAYELDLENITRDTIISFEYTMVKFMNGIFEGSEEKAFGGNNKIEPGEKFSILSRMELDAPDVRFLLKSVSWQDSGSGALFVWRNARYEEDLRKMKLE